MRAAALPVGADGAGFAEVDTFAGTGRAVADAVLPVVVAGLQPARTPSTAMQSSEVDRVDTEFPPGMISKRHSVAAVPRAGGVNEREQRMEQATVRQRRIPPAEVGQMIGRARMRAGLRGPECAREVGISRPFMFRLETGQRCPSVDVAERLADVLKLTAEERPELMAAAVSRADRRAA